MKKVLIIIAVIFVVIGIALLVGALIATGFDLSKIGSVKLTENTYTAEGDFDRIEIDVNETDIDFKLSEDGKLSVVCSERENERHTVKIENGTLKIGVDDTREWYEKIFSLFKSPKMTVYLTADHYESLVIDGSTGDVTIPEKLSFGDVNIKISTGKIYSESSADGNYKIKSSTGDITLKGVMAKDIDVEVSTGDVTFIDTVSSGSLNVKASTGDIRFENSDAHDVKVKTSTGDVTGNFRTDKVFATKTSTGSVVVPDTHTGGKCEITTSTGDIVFKYSK